MTNDESPSNVTCELVNFLNSVYCFRQLDHSGQLSPDSCSSFRDGLEVHTSSKTQNRDVSDSYSLNGLEMNLTKSHAQFSFKI
jgi:hypothetical protein